MTLKLKLERKFKVHALMFKVWALGNSIRQSEWKEKKQSNQFNQNARSTWTQWDENCLMVYTKLHFFHFFLHDCAYAEAMLRKRKKHSITFFHSFQFQCCEDYYYFLFWLIIKIECIMCDDFIKIRIFREKGVRNTHSLTGFVCAY